MPLIPNSSGPGDGGDDGFAAELHLLDSVGGGVVDVALEDLLRRLQVCPGAECAPAPREHHSGRAIGGVQPSER
jgi:hypothetical protein